MLKIQSCNFCVVKIKAIVIQLYFLIATSTPKDTNGPNKTERGIDRAKKSIDKSQSSIHNIYLQLVGTISYTSFCLLE